MAIRNFYTTLCPTLAALATALTTALATAPACAFDIVPGTQPAMIATASGPASPPPQSTPAVLFATDAAIGIAAKPAELAQPALTGATDPIAPLGTTDAYFGQSVAGDTATRLVGLRDGENMVSMPEPGNLPLLGVAAIALLLAQLRRSRRPAIM